MSKPAVLKFFVSKRRFLSLVFNCRKLLAASSRPESGSALVLVLLITALLATIAVSFLSTSRVEQIAAKNFSRQNAASGLAELATQQAIAKIQQGFNATGNGTGNFTSVITTQPGAINKYFFSSGTLQTNMTITTELFSSGSGNLSYLNNLQNPSSNSSATTDQWTITGNASERINVFMENITTTTVNGSTQLIGRVAYYVDDDGTKLNLNSATGNRTTLNAALRPSDIAALSANYTNIFASIINGTASSNTSNITAWGHFFRPEQLGAAINAAGGNFSANDLPSLTTAASSASTTANMTHLLTPWGTQRIEINTLSTNATDGTGDASVRSIFEAFTGLNGTTMNATSNSTYGLTGSGLQNVFGGNFATKYTPLGVKQIAANLLQMRELGKLATSMNKTMLEASFNYSGPLIGAGNLTGNHLTGNSRDLTGVLNGLPGVFYSNEIPAEYLGYAPYLVISEIGMSARFHVNNGGNAAWAGGNHPAVELGFKLQPVIELYNPYPVPFTIPNGAFPRVIVRPSELTCNMSWSGPNGNNFNGTFTFPFVRKTTPFTQPQMPAGWDYGSTWMGMYTLRVRSRDDLAKYDLIYQANGNSTTIPPYSKIQTRLFLDSSLSQDGAYTFIPRVRIPQLPNTGANITLHSVSDVKMRFHYIFLLANSGNNATNAVSNYSNTIRDWVLGDEIGELDVGFDYTSFPCAFTWNENQTFNATIAGKTVTYKGVLNWNNKFALSLSNTTTTAPVPTKSAQRISHLTKIPLATPAITIDDSNRNWTTANSSISNAWLANGASWVTSNSSNFGHLGNSNSTSADASLAVPSASSYSTTPSDPSHGDSVSNAVYASSNATDMREPFLLTGNYSCPADLGFVPTNKRWRRLRMQMQPSAEGSRIPDWAMLEVISFGNSTNPNNAFNCTLPVNINGRFYLPGNATTPPAPRTIGIKALAEVLSIGGNGTIQDTMNPATSNSTDATRFKGNTANATTIANAIGNMEWSPNSTWDTRRSNRGFPADQYILPSEIMEIEGVADAVPQTDYNNSSSHFKWNEGRASALIPAVTTRSSFFTIYAYAQALDNQQNIDSEALTKTLVEVESDTSTTPTTYKVKKLYTQPIRSE